MDSELRVLLADDHRLVRDCLRALIDREPDMRVVAEAEDGEDACRLVGEAAPDVAILDVSMPRLDGVAAAARIRRDRPATRVLALTQHDDLDRLGRMIRAGAAGYVLKRAAAEDLAHAIREVACGGRYVDAGLGGRALVELLVPSAARPPRLSGREEEVLRLVALGLTGREVAGALRLSVKTIETHKARGMEKLGVGTRSGIVAHAVAAGWMAGV